MSSPAARRFVLGTAGHVDHGKTTLVEALAGIDTDRLPEEKRRGITIELGFAPWDLDAETHASIVDVPGHRRLVHTMIAGAAGIEVVLLVVAADEGVMPQTREHVAACELLGIRRAVVAVTKLDKAGSELAELAATETAELLDGRFSFDVVACSARTGEGLDALRAAVKRALVETPPPPPSPYAHLAIDRAFSVKGAGTVVTGTLVRGSLAVGQPVVVAGGGDAVLATAIRGLHVHDRAVASADAPTRLAVNLARGAAADIPRGAVLSADPALGVTRAVDVSLRLVAPVKSGATLEAYLGTARTPARLRILRAATEDGGPTLARVTLTRPLAATGDDRVLLRATSVRGSGEAVVAGGRVLDARPGPLRKRVTRVAVLDALVAGDAAAAVRALAREAAPRALPRAALAGRFPVGAAVLERAAEKLVEKGELVRTRPEGWVPRATVLELAALARDRVVAHHAAHPLERGLALETLRQKLGARCGAGVAEEAIRLAARKGAEDPLVVEGELVRLARFDPDAPTAGAGPLEVARGALVAAALKGMSEHQLGEASGTTSRELKTLLGRLVKEGHAVTVGGLWFDVGAVSALRLQVEGELRARGVLTIAAFKDLSGLGRKQAIPLLEMFDREGTTRRVGDDRMPGPRVASPAAP